MPRALWIADRCRAFGLRTVEVDGWRERGSSTFQPRGVVAHHTADGPGELPSLRVLINGRSDLPGPLCQVGLGRSGTVYVIASGRANHAGRGGWKGLSGNSSVLGIEAENAGGAQDPWPSVQYEAYKRLCAALITGPGVGGDVELICGHKEWAPGRKPDPHTIDMTAFRAEVRAFLEQQEDDFMALFKNLEEFKEAVRAVLREEAGENLDERIGGVYRDDNGKVLSITRMLVEGDPDGEGYADGVKVGLNEIRAARRDIANLDVPRKDG